MAHRPKTRPDPSDGLPATEVHAWAEDKHERLRRYVLATSEVRRGWVEEPGHPTYGPGGAAFIDVYSGPGRSYDVDSRKFIDGSPLAAQRAALDVGVPFTHFIISDLDSEFVSACETRLGKLGANVIPFAGRSEDNIERICAAVPKYGFSIAFIDPYNLVPFSVIEKLACFNHMDLIIHVSTKTLKQNLDRFVEKRADALEEFAPGISSHMKYGQQNWMRNRVMEYWHRLIEQQGFKIGRREEVTNSKGVEIYELMCASRHPLGNDIWDDVANISGQGGLF